jgi:hypothetical protein
VLYDLGLISVTLRTDGKRLVDFTLSYLDRQVVFDSVYQQVQHFREVAAPGGPGILKHADYTPLDETIPRWVMDSFREKSVEMPVESRRFVLDALSRYYRLRFEQS